MDLNNKLKGMPHVYYFNLDNRLDRREYMESQFERWGIDYTRISASKFLASKLNEWKHLISDKNPKLLADVYKSPAGVGNAISHIDFIKTWLETSADDYLILMEDDYDLNLIEYWHFDWQYMMKNIPYDWDCIQLGFEAVREIKFFLHPKPAYGTFFGPCMITRRYAQKLVDLHYKNGKFLFRRKVCNIVYKKVFPGVDYFMCENGRTYCLPLITTNNDFGSYEDNKMKVLRHHVLSRKAYYQFWTKERDLFTLEEFFMYGKPKDLEMTVVNAYDRLIYHR